MKKDYLLRFEDYSYKECEVTGRDMGGTEVYEILLSMLKPGAVEWPLNGSTPNHSIVVEAVGEDNVSLAVTNVAGTCSHPTLHAGETYSDSYMYGEWSYSCHLSLTEADEAAITAFLPEHALKKAETLEGPVWQKRQLYENAARLGSPEAWAWLVRLALSADNGRWGPELPKARDLVEKAIKRGAGQMAQEAYEARETFYVTDGVLRGVYRGGKVLMVPKCVHTIAAYCFSRCLYQIEKLVISPSVTTIKKGAFENCKFVKEIEIQGPTLIEDDAFLRCRNLRRIALAATAKIEQASLQSLNRENVEVVRLP